MMNKRYKIDESGMLILPEGLKVDGYLDLRGCTSLTHLPEGLKVDGNLDLYGCTSLTHLPDGLSVGRDLYLFGCTSLTHLTEGLKVDGYLDLRGCTSLTHLPEGIKIGCALVCDHFRYIEDTRQQLFLKCCAPESVIASLAGRKVCEVIDHPFIEDLQLDQLIIKDAVESNRLEAGIVLSL